MKLKVYAYAKCDTCRRALKLLESRGIAHTVMPIREQPPTRAELARMLKAQGGNLRKLFNTSGQDYQRLGLRDKLPAMSVDEALALLSGNGNLVKRPFVLTVDGGLVGFDEERWKTLK